MRHPTRRTVVGYSAASLGAFLLPLGLRAPGPELPRGGFGFDEVIDEAAQLADRPFEPPVANLPDRFKRMGYVLYHDLRPRESGRLWLGEDLPFTAEVLHPGFLFQTPVEIAVVESGEPARVAYSPEQFEFGAVEPPPATADYGFSGFRLFARGGRGRDWKEFVVFQGASYFRALGLEQVHGLSARGLAIGSGRDDPEEFPLFRKFWLEKPRRGAEDIVVWALLDSLSVSGAYRFGFRPGHSTVADVEAVLFPRADIAVPGLAPLTAMFWFDGSNTGRFPDYRRAVHDSNALIIQRSSGEVIHRHLANPRTVQLSAFEDTDPRGFGLIQAGRDYGDFLDLEAQYHRRPDLWIEPVGRWGEGAVELVELPTRDEYHDNIVAYWRPKGGLKAGRRLDLHYRMHWGVGTRAPADLARVDLVRMGMTKRDEALFVVEFAGPVLDADVEPDVSVSAGRLVGLAHRKNPVTGGVRVSFRLKTHGIDFSELRLVLVTDGRAVSRTWLYRWTRWLPNPA